MHLSPQSLLGSSHQLPIVPQSVLDLIATFNHSRIDIGHITRLIKSDPAMAAQVLRLANSAYFRRSRTLNSVGDAVLFLGVDALRMLVVGAAFAKYVNAPKHFDHAGFWRYSQHAAVTAQYFAERTDADPHHAFIGGLLHLMGEPALQLDNPHVARELSDLPIVHHARAYAERECLGFAYPEVGAELATQWNFPSKIVHAIRYSDQPFAARSFSRLTACVHLGSVFARGFEQGIAQELTIARLHPKLYRAMGMTVKTAAQMGHLPDLARGLNALLRE